MSEKMLTNSEIFKAQQVEAAWAKTPLGAAFYSFKIKLGHAWGADNNPNISDKRLREAWDRADSAEAELRAQIATLESQAALIEKKDRELAEAGQKASDMFDAYEAELATWRGNYMLVVNEKAAALAQVKSMREALATLFTLLPSGTRPWEIVRAALTQSPPRSDQTE